MDQQRFENANRLWSNGQVKDAAREFHAMAMEANDPDEKAAKQPHWPMSTHPPHSTKRNLGHPPLKPLERRINGYSEELLHHSQRCTGARTASHSFQGNATKRNIAAGASGCEAADALPGYWVRWWR